MKQGFFLIMFLFSILSASDTRDVNVTSIAFAIPADKNLIVLQRNCQWCHSYGYIVNQGKQSKEFWNKLVVRMREVYKAPISVRDELLATEYLYKHFGTSQEK